MIEQQQQRKSYFKPIPRDQDLDSMDKNSMKYRRRLRLRACMLCTNLATQMLVRELEGCKKVERYCDACASKQGTVKL